MLSNLYMERQQREGRQSPLSTSCPFFLPVSSLITLFVLFLCFFSWLFIKHSYSLGSMLCYFANDNLNWLVLQTLLHVLSVNLKRRKKTQVIGYEMGENTMMQLKICFKIYHFSLMNYDLAMQEKKREKQYSRLACGHNSFSSYAAILSMLRDDLRGYCYWTDPINSAWRWDLATTHATKHTVLGQQSVIHCRICLHREHHKNLSSSSSPASVLTTITNRKTRKGNTHTNTHGQTKSVTKKTRRHTDNQRVMWLW